MNRFSQKQTVSKFTTAVRETVGFLTTFAAAFAVATTLLFSVNVSAQTVTSENELQTAMKNMRDECAKNQSVAANKTACELATRIVKTKGGIDDTRMCTKAEDEIGKIAEKASKSCAAAGFGSNFNRCYDTIAACNQAEEDLADLDEEEEGGEYCNKMLANSCPGIPRFNSGRDYRDEKKSAELERKEAKKELDALMDDERDIKKDLTKQQREIQEEQQTAAYEARQQEREIANSLKDALEGISNNQKKAFENAQKAFSEMDAQYIKMRRDARLSADAVAQAEDDLEESCRGVAEKKYNEAEKVRLATQKQGRTNVGATVSGSTKKKRAIKNKARLIDYTAFFNECKNGTSAEGASARNKIKTAQRAKATNDALLVEQSALIESERERMLKQIQSLESDANNQQTKVVESINEQLTAMNEKRTLVAQQNQARISEFQQNQNASLQSTQQKIATANQELMKTQKESSVAAKRESCLGVNAQRTETKREKVLDGFSSGYVDITDLDASCKLFARRCPGGAEGSTSSPAPLGSQSGAASSGTTQIRACALAEAAVKGHGTGKRKKKFNIDPEEVSR